MAKVVAKSKGDKSAKASKSLKSRQDGGVISFPGHGHAFLLALMAVSAAVALAIVFVLIEPELTILIKPPLILVLICALALISTAFKQTRDTKLVMAPTALEVTGPQGRAKYAWSKIEAVRVVGAVGSFADDPLQPATKRIGLALFLRGGNEGRIEANEADAILAVGDQRQGEKFVEAASQITKALRSRQRGSKSKPVALPGPPRRREQFALRSAS